MLLLQRHRTISGRNRYYCFGEWMTTAAACVRELSPAAVGELSHDTPLLRVAAYACSHAVAFAQYAIYCLLPRGLSVWEPYGIGLVVAYRDAKLPGFRHAGEFAGDCQSISNGETMFPLALRIRAG